MKDPKLRMSRNFRPSRSQLRIIFLVLVIFGVALVAVEFAGAHSDDDQSRGYGDFNDTSATTAGPIFTGSSYHPDDYTVITSVKGAITAEREKGTIMLVDPKGDLVYENHSYNIYDDVDMSPDGRWTFTYLAAEELSGSNCTEFESSSCTRNFIERLNVSTEETERLYADKTAGVTNTRWHDADRIDDHRFLLADIAHDRILIVNTTTDSIEWKWEMKEEFDPETTGGDSGDWSHLNDVEMLENGYIMASPRNHDQVIFIKPGEGINESMTLGSDEVYEILYEQHNPDYLSAPGEPPSVLVADSQNNRIIEYAREDVEWKKTWEWADEDLQWPRDADRLPNGNTLITDTSGGRVVEVTPTGEVVWGVYVQGGYDAERLGTREESRGGLPATALNETGSVNQGITTQLPPFLRLAVNGILFVLPPWAGLATLTGGMISILGGMSLLSSESFLWARSKWL